MTLTTHDQVFTEAFDNADNIAIALPDLDVNCVISDNYTVNRPSFSLTKTQLWEMECRKAAAPDKYIPTFVKAGSVENFPSTCDQHRHFECFTRITNQKNWKDPLTYGIVIEHVKVDHESQVVTFIGADEFTTPDGRHIVAGKNQPIFHVQHGVTGSEENRPWNTWRVVHLTKGRDDPKMRQVFVRKGNDLPEYVEIYIRNDLGLSLVRRED